MSYYQTQVNQPIPAGLGALQPDGLGAYYQARPNQLIGLGQACPQGTIASGPQCIPCPPGSGLPECAPIARASFWERSQFWGPVLTAAAMAVGGALAVGYISKRTKLGRALTS
jgi:hypothetical protein